MNTKLTFTNMCKECLICLLCLAMFLSSQSQKFKRIKDPILPTTTIRYYDVDAQIILQKTLTEDSSHSPIYEIGLIVFDKTIASDNFMDPSALVVFDDDIKWIFDNQVNVNYLYSGKHQLYIRHHLRPEELKIIQMKNIKMFKIGYSTKSLDKWQAARIKAGALMIEDENVKR